MLNPATFGAGSSPSFDSTATSKGGNQATGGLGDFNIGSGLQVKGGITTIAVAGIAIFALWQILKK
jgi:hypothetical protein